MTHLKQYVAGIAVLASLVGTTAIAQTVQETGQGIRFFLGNDRYEAGNTIVVTDAIEGDIFAAGSQIAIQSAIGGDVNAAGSTISILSPVGDDVRAAGATLLVQQNIGGDAMLFGADIRVAENSSISGSAVLSGESVTIDGNIAGNVKIDGQTVTINGSISGTADIRAKKLIMNGVVNSNSTVRAKELTIGEGGQFGSDLRYWTASDRSGVDAMVAGAATYDETLGKDMVKQANKKEVATIAAAVFSAFFLWQILTILVMLIIFHAMTKTLFVDAAKTLKKAPAKSLLWGLLFFIVMPIAAVLCMITVIGIPVGIIFLLVYILSLIVALPMAALTFAHVMELRTKRKKAWSATAIIALALLFAVLLKLLWIIPVLGWLIKCLFVALGYGAVLQAKSARYDKVK